MSFPSCNNTNQENENNTCCLPECSNGTANTTCDQQCPIGMSMISTNNYSAFCQQVRGISNLTDFNKICLPTCPLNFVKVMINQIALCIECKDICVSTLAREYTYNVCSCDDEVTITPSDQSDQPEKSDNFFNHNYFIFILSGSIGVIIIVIVASSICTCRWRRAYKRLQNKHSQNQDISSQLRSLESRGQHYNENPYVECNHEDNKTQNRKTKHFLKRITAYKKRHSKKIIKCYRNTGYESVYLDSTTTKKPDPEKPDENVEVDRIIPIQPASDEDANAHHMCVQRQEVKVIITSAEGTKEYLPMSFQRQGETGTPENIKPDSNVYQSMYIKSETVNGSADHSSTSTNCNTNALSIPKSHNQSKKSNDTIPKVRLGEDAYSSNASVLQKKQMVARDITHKASEYKGKVSDPCSLKDETEQEKSGKYSQAELVYENLYIGKQIPIVKSGSSLGTTMKADVTSEPLHEISNKAIENNLDMKLTISTVDSSQKLHPVEDDDTGQAENLEESEDFKTCKRRLQNCSSFRQKLKLIKQRIETVNI